MTCPGRTEFCTGCYATNLENAYRSAGDLVRTNYATLTALGNNVPAIADALASMLHEWRAQCAKLDAPLVFRIHWDGDFYSVPYARAWRRIIDANTDVTFWTYTRSFTGRVNVLPALYGAPNLHLYLSVDSYNVKRAATMLAKYPELHIAACAETQADARIIADKLERTATPCPENVGKLPLVVAPSGRRTEEIPVGTDGQGACIACGLCTYGRRDVAFATNKR